MQPSQASSRRELISLELPRTLIYATALTCGVLAALALQIQLARTGSDLVGLWQSLASGKGLQLRTAGPWWGLAGAAFVVGGATAAALARMPLPWHRFRLLRWLAGAAIVVLLADIGHSAAAAGGARAGAHLAATLAGLGVAAVMAMLGAYFTGRR
jgi:hypothetical protein